MPQAFTIFPFFLSHPQGILYKSCLVSLTHGGKNTSNSWVNWVLLCLQDYGRICCLRKVDHPLSFVGHLHYKHLSLCHKSRTEILSQEADFQPFWKYMISSLRYIVSGFISKTFRVLTFQWVKCASHWNQLVCFYYHLGFRVYRRLWEAPIITCPVVTFHWITINIQDHPRVHVRGAYPADCCLLHYSKGKCQSISPGAISRLTES